MTELSAITGVNTVVRTLTGPRRLRSALRQQTAPLTRLLVALDGPCELRATIPAAVFGGDIFGVISDQLRAALIAPPATAPVISRPHRKHSLPSPANPFAKHSRDVFSENVFSPLAARLKPLTLPGETSVSPGMSFRNAEEPSLESLAEVSEDPPRQQIPATTLAHALPQSIAHALERSSLTGLSTIGAARSPDPRFAAAPPALVNSLNRYWQHSSETNRATRANESIAVSEQPGASRDATGSDVEQSRSSVWPNSMMTDAFKSRTSVNESRAPFNETTSRVAGRALRSEHRNSGPNPDFNFRGANNHAPHYDDLSDRLAQILHEQALQHGIDVT